MAKRALETPGVSPDMDGEQADWVRLLFSILLWSMWFHVGQVRSLKAQPLLENHLVNTSLEDLWHSTDQSETFDLKKEADSLCDAQASSQVISGLRDAQSTACFRCFTAYIIHVSNTELWNLYIFIIYPFTVYHIFTGQYFSDIYIYIICINIIWHLPTYIAVRKWLMKPFQWRLRTRTMRHGRDRENHLPLPNRLWKSTWRRLWSCLKSLHQLHQTHQTISLLP